MTVELKTAFGQFSNNIAIRDSSGAFTYAELVEYGRSLIGLLPRQRSLVALLTSLTVESVAAYVALLVDGHVPLLIESDLSQVLADQLLTRYRPDVIIDPVRRHNTHLSGDPVDLHSELGILLTTSGSTGSPKLVRLKATGMSANANAIAQYLEISSAERAMLHLPMSYSFGLSIINSHFVVGASVCLTRKSVMEAGYWEEFQHHEATSFSGVPFHYTALRRLGTSKLELPSLRTLTQAGGRLDPKLADFFIEWAHRTGRKFVMMYGQTEAGPRITYLPSNRSAHASDSIGLAIPGVRIELVNQMGGIVTDQEPGEMRVHSPAVMMGYATNAEDLSLGDQLQGVLSTGDLAYLGKDGLFRIVGRSSRILKVFGLRVNLDEVEQRLADMGVQAACFGDEDKLNILVTGDVDVRSVRDQMLQLFSIPPRSIEVRLTASLERTSSGKMSADILRSTWLAAGQKDETSDQ